MAGKIKNGSGRKCLNSFAGAGKAAALLFAALCLTAGLGGCGAAETALSSGEASGVQTETKEGAQAETGKGAQTETKTEAAAAEAEETGLADAGTKTSSGLMENGEARETSGTSEAETKERGTGERFDSTEEEEHALSQNSGEASYDGIYVTKSGSGEGDQADFYGTNAAVYAENGAKLRISNALIQTDGSHANAVFSYGEGTEIHISDSTIETEQNNSGGVMVTGGGSLTAENLTVTTKGGSSAPIRSDRGGGIQTVIGGTYTSYGSGSPAVYSTADVTVTDAVLYADVSQAVVVEGKNSVTLINTDATGKNTKKNSSHSSRCQAVMVYQSMSGDAGEGCGKFTMTGGSLTSLKEGMFFVTNTVAELTLKAVELNMASEDLLRIEAAGWGTEGSNGGQVTFTAEDQELEGIITVDEVSALNLLLSDSRFEGSIEADGSVYVELDSGAVWKLTGDSSITALTCGENAIDLNGYQLTVDGTLYQEGTASAGEQLEMKMSWTDGKDGSGEEDRKKNREKEESQDSSVQKDSGETVKDPSEKPEGENAGEPPAKPGEKPDEKPSAKPGGGSNGEPPAKPEGDGRGGSQEKSGRGDGNKPPAKPGEEENAGVPEEVTEA